MKAIKVDRCTWCGRSIYTGEEYEDFKKKIICMDCLPDYLYKHRKIGGEDYEVDNTVC